MAKANYSPKDFRPLRAWLKDEGGAVFPTFGSLEWFIRLHGDELRDSGELIARRGRTGSLAGPNFGAVAIQILQRCSRNP